MNTFTKAYTYIHKDDHELIVPPRDRAKLFLPFLSLSGRILELGCGEGLLASCLRDMTDAEVYGIDASRSGIRLASKRGIHASVSDLNRKLSYPNDYFDSIVSDQLIEHIFKVDHLLDEIYRVLKPGGVVVTITPNLSYWFNRVLFLLGIYPIFLEPSDVSKTYGMGFFHQFIHEKDAQGHIRVGNYATFKDMFMSHGFIILSIKGSPFSWKIPKIYQKIYDLFDIAFSRFPSLARDIIIVAQKPG